MTNKVERNWHLSETLFKDLNLDPDRKVEKVKVVECPDEFVKTKMRVQIWKDDEGNDKRFQPINMKNPISGMSMSGDEGRTWTTMNHFGETDSFLRPSELSRTSKQTIRVESWIGGSNVLISSQSGSLWTAGQDGSDGGNNICRGIFRFTQDIPKSYSLQKYYIYQVLASFLGRFGRNGANAQLYLVETAALFLGREKLFLEKVALALVKTSLPPRLAIHPAKPLRSWTV